MPFYRQHFQINFILWKIAVFLFKFQLNLFLGVQFTNKPSVGSENGLTPNKQHALYEPIMAYITDTYMCLSISQPSVGELW